MYTIIDQRKNITNKQTWVWHCTVLWILQKLQWTTLNMKPKCDKRFKIGFNSFYYRMLSNQAYYLCTEEIITEFSSQFRDFKIYLTERRWEN